MKVKGLKEKLEGELLRALALSDWLSAIHFLQLPE